MTANQINYMKYLEDIRSHKANETAATRQAQAAERQASVAERNAETNRMNAETNAYNSILQESAVGAQWFGAQANKAYQEAMANVSAYEAREGKRHNIANEGQALLNTAVNAYTSLYASDTSRENTRSSNITSERNVNQQTETSRQNTQTTGWFNLAGSLLGILGKGALTMASKGLLG